MNNKENFGFAVRQLGESLNKVMIELKKQESEFGAKLQALNPELAKEYKNIMPEILAGKRDISELRELMNKYKQAE